MRKFRLYLDKDAEIVWLNEMAAQGWAMTGFLLEFIIYDLLFSGIS